MENEYSKKDRKFRECVIAKRDREDMVQKLQSKVEDLVIVLNKNLEDLAVVQLPQEDSQFQLIYQEQVKLNKKHI